ncbi:MAG: response regulator [Lachnospiraceae bacterium]|nr:response regulator [Lachnospiraceae bacterium]
MAEANIVIVRAQESVVVRGIAKKLENEGCRVTLIGETVSEVTRYIPTGALFICYLSETMLEDAKSLNVVSKIIDAFHEKRIRSIVIGEEKHRRDLLESIPALSSQVFMKRPVDMEALLNVIKEVQKHAEKAGEAKHLLLVDDDPSYAKIVREWLKDDYQVNVVTAGMQAITFLTQNEVDLVLLDYEMPGLDGPKVLEIIRSEPATAKTPVIFLTGIGTKESVAKVAAFNPQGYILKTATKDELLQKLRNFFA